MGMIIGEEESKRSEILYNIDPDFDDNGGHGAIRIGDIKLMIGVPGDHNDHYPPDTSKSSTDIYDYDGMVSKDRNATKIKWLLLCSIKCQYTCLI